MKLYPEEAKQLERAENDQDRVELLKKTVNTSQKQTRAILKKHDNIQRFKTYQRENWEVN